MENDKQTSGSLFCFAGGEVQLHSAHHLHRINAVVLRAGERTTQHKCPFMHFVLHLVVNTAGVTVEVQSGTLNLHKPNEFQFIQFIIVGFGTF